MSQPLPVEAVEALSLIRALVRKGGPPTLALLYPVLMGLAGEALTGMLPPAVSTVGQSPEASQEDEDEALTSAQCARLSGWRRDAAKDDRAGFSPGWFRNHADELPFRIGGRGRHPIRFSRRGLRAWLSCLT